MMCEVSRPPDRPIAALQPDVEVERREGALGRRVGQHGDCGEGVP
jgi:hypothetical protein